MSTSHGLGKKFRTEVIGSKMPGRLGVFLVCGLVLLLLQYPIGILRLCGVLDAAFFVLLVHCVVMFVDAAFAVCRGEESARAKGTLAYFIPVEGRGLPQLITLVACMGVMAAATKLHDLGGSPGCYQQ